MAPLFSVVTPVYDPPVDVLRATVSSVLAQEHTDWEMVLVDDCSTNPAVRAVLREFAAFDPRITVIKVTPSDGYYWDTKHGNAVAGIV